MNTKKINTLRICSKIKKRRNVVSLLKNVNHFKCSCLEIFYKENRLKTSRIGILISRKHGKPFSRNRYKRTIREFFRTRITLLNKKYDVIVLLGDRNFSLRGAIVKGLSEWYDRLREEFS